MASDRLSLAITDRGVLPSCLLALQAASQRMQPSEWLKPHCEEVDVMASLNSSWHPEDRHLPEWECISSSQARATYMPYFSLLSFALLGLVAVAILRLKKPTADSIIMRWTPWPRCGSDDDDIAIESPHPLSNSISEQLLLVDAEVFGRRQLVYSLHALVETTAGPGEGDHTLSLVRNLATSVVRDPAVPQSPCWCDATLSPLHRDLLDVDARVLRAESAEGCGIFSTRTTDALEQLFDACACIALAALREVGEELGVGEALCELCARGELHKLRLLRHSHEGEPMMAHTDSGLITLHVALNDCDGGRPFLWWEPSAAGRALTPSSGAGTVLGDAADGTSCFRVASDAWSALPPLPLIFPGDQMELVTNGRIAAVRHGVLKNRPRSALVFMVFADSGANLSPLHTLSAPLTPLPSRTLEPHTEGSLARILHEPMRKVFEADAGLGDEFDRACTAASRKAFDLLGTPQVKLPELLDVGIDELRTHWRLMQALVLGEDGNSPLPSVATDEGKAYWRVQTTLYAAWLVAVESALRDASGADGTGGDGSSDEAAMTAHVLALPPPPRGIRWCWVAHMLQPSCYQADCISIFGAVLPHANSIPYTEHPSDAFTLWWRRAFGESCPLKGEVQLPHLAVDWDKGLDSCATLYAEVLATSVDFVEDDACAVDVLTQYRRYIFAAQQCDLARLSPGAMVDLAWHAHQTSPVRYGSYFFDRQMPLMDHEPCGELNPAEPEWLENSRAAWAKLFPGEAPPSYGSHSLGPCCCCAAQIAEQKRKEREREEAQRRKAEAERQRQREVQRLEDAERKAEAARQEAERLSKEVARREAQAAKEAAEAKQREKEAAEAARREEERKKRQDEKEAKQKAREQREAEEKKRALAQQAKEERAREEQVRSEVRRLCLSLPDELSRKLKSDSKRRKLVQTLVTLATGEQGPPLVLLCANTFRSSESERAELVRFLLNSEPTIAGFFACDSYEVVVEWSGSSEETALSHAVARDAAGAAALLLPHFESAHEDQELQQLVRDKAKVHGMRELLSLLQMRKTVEETPLPLPSKGRKWVPLSQMDAFSSAAAILSRAAENKGKLSLEHVWYYLSQLVSARFAKLLGVVKKDKQAQESLLHIFETERKASLEMYAANLRRVRLDPTFGEYKKVSTKLQDDIAKLQRPCKQSQRNFPLLRWEGGQLQQHFEDFLQKLSDRSGTAVSKAPLKGPWRSLEKMALSSQPSLDAFRICDVVRGSLCCSNFDELTGVLELLSYLDEQMGDSRKAAGFGSEFKIRLLRLKDRFVHPTSGGWADCLINFTFVNHELSSHVVELQLQHTSLLLTRKEAKGHEAYSMFRTAFEVLEALGKPPQAAFEVDGEDVHGGGLVEASELKELRTKVAAHDKTIEKMSKELERGKSQIADLRKAMQLMQQQLQELKASKGGT